MASTDVGADHGTLHHLVQLDIWKQCKDSAQPYFPPTYEVRLLPYSAAARIIQQHNRYGSSLQTFIKFNQLQLRPLQADGFIHLTKEPQLLLGVANHFYTQVPGTFLVLAIDSTKLSSKVRTFTNWQDSDVMGLSWDELQGIRR
jgi:hypothetical protein